MGAVPQPIHEAFEPEHNFNKNPQIIQLRPYLGRDARRISEGGSAVSPSDMVGEKVRPNEISPQAVFEMLSEVTLPKMIFKMIQDLFQENIREQKAMAAFAKADAEFCAERSGQPAVDDHNSVSRRASQGIRKPNLYGSSKHEKERTRRIISLTGSANGDIEDVLNWEV